MTICFYLFMGEGGGGFFFFFFFFYRICPEDPYVRLPKPSCECLFGSTSVRALCGVIVDRLAGTLC